MKRYINALILIVILLTTVNTIAKKNSNFSDLNLLKLKSINHDIEITFNYPDEIQLCNNDTYTLTTKYVSGYNYKWFKNDTLINNRNINSLVVKKNGIYHVEVSKSHHNYISSKKVLIQYSNIEKPNLKLAKLDYCLGEVATITITNNVNHIIKWYLNGNELIANANKVEINTNKPGNYVAKFINLNGCSNISDSYNIDFVALPLVSISKNTNKQICSGDYVTLSANYSENNATFLWSNGETTKQIKVYKSGAYWVEIKNLYGCITKSNIEYITINEPIILKPTVDAKLCAIFNEQTVLEAESGFAYYYWNDVKTTNRFFTVTKPGTYNLKVEDTNGCTSTTKYTVLAYCDKIIVPNAFSPNGDGINDLWQIVALEYDPNAIIKIFNRSGTVIYKTTGYKPYWDGKINGVDAMAGTYYYSIKTTKTNETITGALSLIR
jgi:gliding motility-associated-like protein